MKDESATVRFIPHPSSFLLPLLLLWVGACGGSAARPVKVAGQLTLDGAELSGAVVTFCPAGEGGARVRTITSRGGYFRLSCAPGRYKVTAAPLTKENAADDGGPLPLPSPEDSAGAAATIPAVYRDARTTPLEIEVPEGGSDAVLLAVVRGKGP